MPLEGSHLISVIPKKLFVRKPIVNSQRTAPPYPIRRLMAPNQPIAARSGFGESPNTRPVFGEGVLPGCQCHGAVSSSNTRTDECKKRNNSFPAGTQFSSRGFSLYGQHKSVKWIDLVVDPEDQFPCGQIRVPGERSCELPELLRNRQRMAHDSE